METKFRTYGLTFSCLICTLTFETRYFPAQERRWGWCVMCVLLTLLFGWWHIPFGPIHTLHTIGRNLCGGEVQTIREIFEKAVGGKEKAAKA